MFAELLRQKLAGIVDLSAEQVFQLEEHYKLLQHWNRVLNLTAIRDMEESVERHYCESLFLGSHLPLGRLSVADIGSGAGFPGFPVAVLRPDCAVTLIESHQRKAVFLKEASRSMANIRVLPTRIEKVQDHFDWAISRAVNYTDVRPDVERLADNIALLTTETAPIRIPWGQSRYVWLFHVKHYDSL